MYFSTNNNTSKIITMHSNDIYYNFLFASNYNLLVIERLLKEGYYPMDYDSSDKLIKKRYLF